MVARFVRDEEVAGSNPVTPTTRTAWSEPFGDFTNQAVFPFTDSRVIVLADAVESGAAEQTVVGRAAPTERSVLRTHLTGSHDVLSSEYTPGGYIRKKGKEVRSAAGDDPRTQARRRSIGTALGLCDAATVALSIVLAFAFGYGLTMRGVLHAGVRLAAALKVALAADTVSILVMEIVDNAVLLGVPGAMEAGLTTWLFWASLAFSLIVAFVVTVPVNRWMIGHGKGHAVVHAYHH